jgi:hypothetical protein
MTTIAPMVIASTSSRSSTETVAAPSRSQMTGLANWRTNNVSDETPRSRRISFGPNSESLCALQPTKDNARPWMS